MLNRLPPAPFTPRTVGALIVLALLVAFGVILCVGPTTRTTPVTFHVAPARIVWYTETPTKKPLGLHSQGPLLTSTYEETYAWLTTNVPYPGPKYET